MEESAPFSAFRLPAAPRRPFLLSHLVGEGRPLRHQGEEAGRRAAGLVLLPLPFADRLLARPQLVGQLLLGEAEMPSQRLYPGGVQAYLIFFLAMGESYTETCTTSRGGNGEPPAASKPSGGRRRRRQASPSSISRCGTSLVPIRGSTEGEYPPLPGVWGCPPSLPRAGGWEQPGSCCGEDADAAHRAQRTDDVPQVEADRKAPAIVWVA